MLLTESPNHSKVVHYLSWEAKVKFSARDHARTEFELVLKQRSKEIATPLLKALEDAFNLARVQTIIENDVQGMPVWRREKIHRKRIGKLARGLSQMIATTAAHKQIAAEDIRLGYERWKQTESFRSVARGYHHHRMGGGTWLGEREASISQMK